MKPIEARARAHRLRRAAETAALAAHEAADQAGTLWEAAAAARSAIRSANALDPKAYVRRETCVEAFRDALESARQLEQAAQKAQRRADEAELATAFAEEAAWARVSRPA